MTIRRLYEEWMRAAAASSPYWDALPAGGFEASRENPLCGDSCRAGIASDGGVLRRVGFEGRACLVTKATAALLGGFLALRKQEEARARLQALCAWLESREPSPAPDAAFAPLEGLKAYPLRVPCALLPVRACVDALAGR